MDRTQEDELMPKALAGDLEARNAIILGFSGMIYQKALAVKCMTPVSDLYNVGILRILKVFHTFKPELGYRASTYFSTIAYRAMVRFAAYEDRLIRFPKDKSRFEAALETFWTIDSLDRIDDNGFSIGSRVADRETIVPDLERYPEVEEALKSLSDRERKIVTCRQRGQTLRSIGESMNLTRERVRQIEQRSYVKLRELLRGPSDGLSRATTSSRRNQEDASRTGRV